MKNYACFSFNVCNFILTSKISKKFFLTYLFENQKYSIHIIYRMREGTNIKKFSCVKVSTGLSDSISTSVL